MSDTPETDALREAIDNGKAAESEMTSLAGKLERERDELREDQSNQEDMLLRYMDEVDEAREKAERYRLEANAMMAKLHELQTYADRLADGLPAGMLPRDVENLREANAGLADDLQKAQQERDEAREERDKIQTEFEMWRDGNILHEVHRNELEKAERERDEARTMLERTWHEDGAPLLKMMRERDEAREELSRYKRQWDEARSENVEDATGRLNPY